MAQLFAGERGRLVIGALPSLAARLLPRLIKTFQHQHPAIEIVVRDTLSGTLERQFQERQIDLGLIAQSQDLGQLEFTPIATEPFGLVCAAGSDLDQSGDARWDALSGHPFIAMAPLSSVRIATDLALSRMDAEVKPLFECTHLATVGGLIEAGLGISVLPRSTLPLLEPGRFAWRRLIPVAERTLGLAKLSGRSLSPAAAAFARHITTHAAAMLA